MKLSLSKLPRCKNGLQPTFDYLINTRDFFRYRDKNRKDAWYGTYSIWQTRLTKSGYYVPIQEVYIGQGLIYDPRVYGLDVFLNKSRALHHDGQIIEEYLRVGWEARITSIGLTKDEARVLEALLIRLEIEDGRSLTPVGAETWDGYSLMNKNRGLGDKTWEMLSDKYLMPEWK